LLSWLGRRLGYNLEKTQAALPEYVFEPEARIRKPLFDYISLFEVATTSWVLRKVFRAIIQESTRNRWHIAPRFKVKCDKCGKEYNTSIDKCATKECGGTTREPSQKQYLLFDRIMRKPNPDYKMDDFVRSSIFYDLALDDWYWSIAYSYEPKTKNGKIVLDENKQAVMIQVPKEIYVEDARFIFPIADEYGHLGNNEYFCPNCYDLTPLTDTFYTAKPGEIVPSCPLCQGPQKRTAYVQEIGGTIKARYSKDEIIHGSSSRVLPSLFGNSKIITVWKLVQTIASMDDYNWEVYTEGKVGSFLIFPGEDDIEVSARARKIEDELKRMDNRDVQTGRYRTSKKIRTIMTGMRKGNQPIRIPIMEDLKTMQSMEFYQLYNEAISAVYGVTPIFVSVAKGTNRNPRMEIDVQARTTQDHQSNYSDLFNEELLLRFGITDWIWEFNPVEERDVTREASVEHTKAATALTWLRGGFQVKLTEAGEVVASGVGKLVGGGEGPGSRVDETPRGREGQSRGDKVTPAPTTSAGERDVLRLARARLPISWYSATQFRIYDKVFAVMGDMDEVAIVVNNVEITGTRESATNINYIIAHLLRNILKYLKNRLPSIPGFDVQDFDSGIDKLVTMTRREYKPDILISVASYFDDIGLNWLAQKFDNLRYRLNQIKPSSLEVQPEEESKTGEMILAPRETERPVIEEVGLIQARAPFGVVHEEEALAKRLERLIKKTTKEYKAKKRKTKQVREYIVRSAMIKARRIIEQSYQGLISKAVEHAKRRTGKKVTASPEELKRLEDYKANSLGDFEQVLRMSLK